jgi:hypothetical protein
MKKFLFSKQSFLLLLLASVPFIFTLAQSASALVFSSYSLESGTALMIGAKYRFTNIQNNVDAVVSIDSLVNGAQVIKIDDNSAGVGYKDAFQPAIQSGNVIGMSYAVFTINFYEGGTNIPKTLLEVNATAVDLDGNSTLKEFVKTNLGAGSVMSYLLSTPDISVTEILPGLFFGQNILGIERTGIDTSALQNMFTVSNADVSSFSIRYGTITTVPSTATRQFSFYMKSFEYPASTLPIKLASFNATLNNKKVDVKWTTVMEENVSHFTIERSFDGISFTDLATVFAYGNSNEARNYAYPDDISTVQSNVLFYRLRSNDNDGKTQYSDIRIIKLSNKNVNTIHIVTYPNPAANQVNVTVPNHWQNKKVAFEIFSANGQVQKRTENNSSSQTESINISNLAPGIYIVQATCNGETAQQKIIKQ